MINDDLFTKIKSSTMVSDRYDHLTYSLNQIDIQSGLFLEFGVFQGESANYIAQIIKPAVLYGFDSFEGLPEEWKRSLDDSLVHPSGTFALNELPEVRPNVELVPGWFTDTLPAFKQQHDNPIAFINIDSDLYSSAQTILTELNAQIVPGTIIYFDEITGWGELIDRYQNWREGEYKALLEWIHEFGRVVEPVSRNERYGATVKVVV
jgi:predicted O-methyltransferase YrrM